MIVECRNGTRHIVILGRFITEDTTEDILAGIDDDTEISRTWTALMNFNDDLTHRATKEFDIIRVYNSKAYAINRKGGLIWQRQDTRELTVSQIEDRLGYKVKIIADDGRALS